MARPASEETKQQWRTNIQNQHASGLPIERWCQANNIVKHAFHYWQKKLSLKLSLIVLLSSKYRTNKKSVVA